MAGTVFIEGEYVAPEDARMSIFDMGFVHSDTVYDVLSVRKGWIFKLDEHLDRFDRSCAGFRLQNRYTKAEMRTILAECVDRAGLEDAYLKVQMTRGVIPANGRDPRLADNQFVAYAIPYVWIWGEENCRDGGSIYIAGVERISSRAVDARFKNYNRADMTRARFEAYDHDCDDAVLLGPDGYLTEGFGWNVFVVKAGAVATPDANCLEGVTREALAELCELEGIPMEIRKVHPGELVEADEVFASTTAGGVMPVIHVGPRPVGDGVPGAITRRLQALYWSKREEGWHGTRVADVLTGVAAG